MIMKRRLMINDIRLVTMFIKLIRVDTMENCTHFNKGNKNNKTAIVLSCPGRLEQENGKPAFGMTGSNLQKLLIILNNKSPEIFGATDRYEYRITNASSKVYYGELTEPLDSEIKCTENIRRLKEELTDMKFVVAFGKKAQYAVELCRLSSKVKIIATRHIGMQSINQITDDKDGNKLEAGMPDNTQKRLEVIANEILQQIE